MFKRFLQFSNLHHLIKFQKNRLIHLKPCPLYCENRSKFLKYEPFRDDRASIIFDVEEEKKRSKILNDEVVVDDNESVFIGISKHRGADGVISIEELAILLRNQNAIDLFVAKVPPEYRYVNHIVVVSGKSARHMVGIVEYVKKVFKYKMHKSDIVPKIEGKKSRDWIAIDLGNIALHIFSQEKRPHYDLESLWSLGSNFDKKVKEPDNIIVSLIKNSTIVNTKASV